MQCGRDNPQAATQCRYCGIVLSEVHGHRGTLSECESPHDAAFMDAQDSELVEHFVTPIVQACREGNAVALKVLLEFARERNVKINLSYPIDVEIDFWVATQYQYIQWLRWQKNLPTDETNPLQEILSEFFPHKWPKAIVIDDSVMRNLI